MTINIVPAAAAQPDREALIARSKMLHALGGQHFRAVMPFLSSARAQCHAKRFSRLRSEAWSKSDALASFVIDLAAWTADEGRSTAVQRYARQEPAPQASDEAAVLAGMQMSVISFWTVQEAHPVAGWIVRDLLNEGTVWVVDEALEGHIAQGARPNFLTRLFRAWQGEFWMTCGTVATVPEALDMFRSRREKDAIQSGSECHAVCSRQSGYVSDLYTMIPVAHSNPSPVRGH
jgi:hypothetical protein